MLCQGDGARSFGLERGKQSVGISAHVVSLSSVHVASDRRIFHAQARTLARAGFQVTLVALEDAPATETDGVRITHLPRPRTRLHRFWGSFRLLRLALRSRGDVFVFHDPELLPAAVLLKIVSRRPLVYDVHEDVRAVIRGRTWLSPWLRVCAMQVYQAVERAALPWIDALTLADSAYSRHYQGCRTVLVRNYPSASNASLFDEYRPQARSRPALIYVGSITCLRGLMEMLALVVRLRSSYPDILLRLIGPVGETRERNRAEDYIARHGIAYNVQWTGRVSHREAHQWILESDIGLVLLHPDPNYVESLPTKMFEYMMMGRPVVASDFPLWAGILEKAGCGFAVDPLNVDAAADAVGRLLDSRELRLRLGLAGRRAVLQQYSWEREGERLVDLYRSLAAGARARNEAPGTEKV